MHTISVTNIESKKFFFFQNKSAFGLLLNFSIIKIHSYLQEQNQNLYQDFPVILQISSNFFSKKFYMEKSYIFSAKN
jgi:hypothetical protein